MKTAQVIKGKLLYFMIFLLSGNCLSAEGMPQFNAKSFNSQLFWLTISFVTLYLIVTYFILPRIRENIRLRKNKIANDLERAEGIKVEIESMISQMNIKVEEAKNQAQKMIKESIQDRVNTTGENLLISIDQTYRRLIENPTNL